MNLTDAVSSLPKKIVLTQHIFSYGGTDRVAAYLASGFADAGFDVHYVVFCDGGDAQDVLETLVNKGVNVHYLGSKQGSRTKDLLRLFPKCVSLLKDLQPDIVLSTCNNMNWITVAASKLSGCGARLILKTTNPIVREKDAGLSGWLRRQGYRIAFEKSDRVLALCDIERDLLTQQFPSASAKFRSVANPYVTDEMMQKPESDSVLEGRKVVLNVGRFEAQKDMELLIRSFALVKDEAAVLVILGDGALKPGCEALAKSLGIVERIEMPGFVPEVTRWLHRADLFVLTSVYEGFPAVILEAMAAGCPILSTDCFLSAKALLEHSEVSAVMEERSPATIAERIDAFLAREFGNGVSYPQADAYSVASGVNSHIQYINEVLALER